MPLRNQIPAKLSARSVYAKQSTSKVTVERGRGRPSKKIPISPVKAKPSPLSKEAAKKGRGRPRKNTFSSVKMKSNFKKKNSPKGRKRKSSVSFRNTAEIIGNNSSEADLSSEGQETDQPNKEYPVNFATKMKNKGDVPDGENDIEVSGEEGDIEDDIGLEDGDKDGDGNDEIVSEAAEKQLVDNGKESKKKQDLVDFDFEVDQDLPSTDGLEDDVYYSLPESSNLPTGNTELTNDQEQEAISSEASEKKIKDEVQMNSTLIKKERIEEKAENQLNGKKRTITVEYEEEVEIVREQNNISSSRPRKKKKKSGRAHQSMENGFRSFSFSEQSRFPSYRQQNFNPTRASTSSFHSSAASSHQQLDSLDSLITLNRSVPSGNIAADQLFRWLIGPTLPVDFFHNIFEKLPCTVQRDNAQYYKDLFTGNDLNTMLKENNLEYGVHVDVVKYVKGMRIPVEANGRAYYSNVWEDYKEGYSLRIRNPQAYNKHLWKLCALLQEYFSSTVGCNIYLTPPKAQGFPPHYDDIDAFIIQVEGKKYWKVYAPRYPEENLARYSSKDFSENELGQPIMQVCLNAGELLYIPRGYIHQAATDNLAHSLHLTFSANQLNTWGDLLLIAANRAVEKAILSDATFRESIPKDYMDFLGTSAADSKTFKRHELINKVKNLAKTAMSHIDVDEAADLHSIKFLQSSLPPVFNKIEKEHSLHGNGSCWKNGAIKLKGVIEEDTEIQLIRKRNLRLVIEDNKPKIYHNLENLQDPKPNSEDLDARYVEMDMEGVPPYLFLLNKFPDFVRVEDIPFEDLDDKISFATSLYENGLLMTKEPLPCSGEDDIDWNAIPDIIPSVKRERF